MKCSVLCHLLLVAGSSIEIHPQFRQIKLNLTWNMSTVNNCDDPCLTRSATNFFDWEDQRRRAGNMAEKNNLGLGCDCRPESFHKLFFCDEWQKNGLLSINCPSLFTHKAPGSVHCTVLMIGSQDFIARLQV